MNSTATKVCKFCKEEKSVDSFGMNKSQKSGLHYYCRSCAQQIRLPYQENNPKYFENYRMKNRKKINQYQKDYRIKNAVTTDSRELEKMEEAKKKKRVKQRETAKNPNYIASRKYYFKKKYQTDIQFKLKKQYESKLNKLFHDGDDTEKAIALIGCTISEFKKYLETKFLPGMSHLNYSKVWVFRHVIPFSHYDLGIESEVKQVLHYTNIEPMFIHCIDGVTDNSNDKTDRSD